jgi:hypothetical protein
MAAAQTNHKLLLAAGGSRDWFLVLMECMDRGRDWIHSGDKQHIEDESSWRLE